MIIHTNLSFSVNRLRSQFRLPACQAGRAVTFYVWRLTIRASSP